MRHILVAVDDSEASGRVSEFVNEFFGNLDVSITAANVGTSPIWSAPDSATPALVHPWPYPGAVPYGGVPPVPPAEISVPDATSGIPDASPARDAAEQTIAASGLNSNDHVVEVGYDVADTLREIAADRDVDLIVVGSTHKGLIERLFSPSVSKELTESSPVPVLVVP